MSTLLRNDINEDGGTPGFDVLHALTLTLSGPSDVLACFNAVNISFDLEVS